jgi:hypothetical protein
MILLVVGLGFMSSQFVGCSPSQWADVQKSAQGTQYVTATPVPATTQPTAAQTSTQNLLDAARGVYLTVANTNPTVAAIGGIIGIVAGAIGAFAGTKTGSTTATASAQSQLKSILTEVATSATGFLPGPWSTVVSDALTAAGLHQVASPTTPTPPPPPGVTPV